MRRALAAAAIAALLAACGQDRPPPPALNGPAVPGESYSLAALVATVSGGQAVTWTVVEPDGGSVTAAGVYTAPACSVLMAGFPVPPAGAITGTAHVNASWSNGSTTITVSISEAVNGIDVSPTSVTTGPGGTVQFHSTVHYTCHDYQS